MHAKILFAKYSPTSCQIRSALVSAGGVYWRTHDTGEDIAAILHREKFDLAVTDCRGANGNVLNLVESLRQQQAQLPVFLISERLELESVVKAIRLGVKDLFNPPLDFRAFVERLATQVYGANATD